MDILVGIYIVHTNVGIGTYIGVYWPYYRPNTFTYWPVQGRAKHSLASRVQRSGEVMTSVPPPPPCLPLQVSGSRLTLKSSFSSRLRAGATDSGLGGSLSRKGALGRRGPFYVSLLFMMQNICYRVFIPVNQTNERYLYAALSAPLHCHATQRSTISPAVSAAAEMS